MAAVATNPAEITAEEVLPVGYKPEVTLSADAKLFIVSWGDHENVKVRADNPREAWAIFCDTIKVWPNPKTGRVCNSRGKQLYPTETVNKPQDKLDPKTGLVTTEYVSVPNPAFKK